ncbi:uncharacterized protein CHAB577_0602 [Chlamydia abortus]|nr:uncharacterized protein CHAB577_0602 [Chlamydia abortus]
MKLNIFSYPLDAAAWFSMFRNADDPLRLKKFLYILFNQN